MEALCLLGPSIYQWPFQNKWTVDVLADAIDLASINEHIWNIVWMGLVIIVIRTLSRVLFFNPGRDVEYRIRRDLFHNLLHLPPSFYATQNRGDIISRASSDITWIRALIGFGGLQSINLCFALSFTLWKMGSVSWMLTGITLAPIVIGTVIVQGAIHSVSDDETQSGKARRDIRARLGPSKCHDHSDFRLNRHSYALAERKAVRQQHTVEIGSIQHFALGCIVGSVVGILFVVFGSPLVEAGTLSVGNIATFIALLAALVPYAIPG